MDKGKLIQNEIRRENDLIKIMTGGTGHSRRLLSNNDIYKINGVEKQVPIISQPICEHCERVVVWDWTVDRFGKEIPLGVCEYCGTITKNPMTFGEYLANGYDIPNNITGNDREGAKQARMWINMMFNVKERKVVR